MSLLNPALVMSTMLLVLCGCGSSASNSARTSESATIGAAQPATESGGGVVSVTTPGQVGAGDGESTGSVIGGGTQDNAQNNQFFIDPTSPEFIESDPLHFRSALPGVWMASECQQVEDLLSQTASSRAVFVFTDKELVETEYLYNSNDCSGTPSSKWYPLPIRSWTLGEYRTLPDGTDVWELDTTISQRGVYGTEVDLSVGTNSYVNIGFVNGDLAFNSLVENYKHTRPDIRSSVYFKKHIPGGLRPLGANALLGTWYAQCTGRLESTYQFNADTLIITDENWADVGCEGDSYAVRKTTFDLQYGDAFTSLFGDELIAVTLTAVTNELIKFDDSQGLDKPEFKVQQGKTEYRAVSIDNNTLILGYCLYRNSGEDDCQDSEMRKPDMVDHNWAVRFTKIL